MARPRTIAPETGDTRKVSVMLAGPLADRFAREAAERGVSFGAVVREYLDRAALDDREEPVAS